MTQIIEKEKEKESPKSEQIESNEILGDLNPRYFEEAMTPENALEKIKASQGGFGGRFTVRPY